MGIVDPNRTRTAFIPAAGIEREIRDIIADEVFTEDIDGPLALWGVDEAALAVVEYLRGKGVDL